MEKEMDIFFQKILASLNDKFKGNWNITDNKAEGRISKRVFQENRARQIFQKNENVCVSGGKKCSFLRKFDVLFSLKHPFWDSYFIQEVVITGSLWCF